MLLIWTAGVLLSAGAPETVRSPPTPIDDPGTWVRDVDYPLEALHNDIAGVVAFKLRIDERGVPVNCDVTQSAHPILDQATCDLLLERARFRPAEGPKGQPVSSHWSSRIDWRIPDESTATVIHFSRLVPFPSSAELVFSLPAGNNAYCRYRAIGPTPFTLGTSPCSFARGGARFLSRLRCAGRRHRHDSFRNCSERARGPLSARRAGRDRLSARRAGRARRAARMGFPVR